ncbi:MAG: universal stress protein [Candidatus Aquicultorales bacterium]
MPSISTPGVIVALVLFVVGIGVGLVLRNLLRRGRKTPVVIQPEGLRGGRILVPFTGDKIPEDALEVAANLARAREASLVLFYIAIVPVTLNIEAELTREVEKGFTALEESERLAVKSGVPTEIRLERERTLRRGIIDILERESFESVVVEMPKAGPGLKLERQIEDIGYLFQRVQEEVVIVRTAKSGAAERGE